MIPAAVIGLLLATYNYIRFDNPLEFGFRYGQNVFFGSGDRIAALQFIRPNLKWYYLTPPTITAEFPFIFPEAALLSDLQVITVPKKSMGSSAWLSFAFRGHSWGASFFEGSQRTPLSIR